jgi:hypothetical protein
MGTGFPGFPADMDSVVSLANKEQKIRLFNKNMVKSDLWFLKNGVPDWKVSWTEGELEDMIGSDHLLHFHFLRSKNSTRFRVAPLTEKKGFVISAEGFYPA